LPHSQFEKQPPKPKTAKKNLYAFGAGGELPDEPHVPEPLLMDEKFEVKWREFVEHRNDIRKPMTKRAASNMLSKLTRLGFQGYAPRLLLERAITNMWQDVYPDKSCIDREMSSMIMPL